MKTLFLVLGLILAAPSGWADAVSDELLSPFTQSKYHVPLEQIRNQCNGKDGCETLMGDMNTSASFDKMPSLDECPGKSCPVCTESEVCKDMVIKMKAVSATTNRSNENLVKPVVLDPTEAELAKKGFKKAK
jgi:hypothetical protein